MNDWWNALTTVNQVFYGAAAFFGIWFIWQLISVFMGLDSDSHADAGDAGHAGDIGHAGGADVDHTYDNFEHGAQSDAGETTVAFKLLSVRSIVTFFTLFTWGSALYLNRGDSLGKSMGISVIWGLVGMLSVGLFFFFLPKLTHTGTKNIKSAVGTNGSVYLDIPDGGVGEVRVVVTGAMTHVSARAADGKGLRAGTPIRVTKQLDDRTIEVTPLTENTKGDA